jgi:hypothetical protein
MPNSRTTSKSRPRVPPTTEQKTPDFFLLPTSLLVEIVKLVGSLPTQQGFRTFGQLQSLQPYEPPAEEDEDDPDEGDED